MTLKVLGLLVLTLSVTPFAAAEDIVLTPTAAAKLEGKSGVLVEFEVKSTTSASKTVRLISAPSFRDKEAFVIQIGPEVIAGLETKGIKNPMKDLVGKKVRAKGKVALVVFSSYPVSHPGIHVSDPANFWIIEPAKPKE